MSRSDHLKALTEIYNLCYEGQNFKKLRVNIVLDCKPQNKPELWLVLDDSDYIIITSFISVLFSIHLLKVALHPLTTGLEKERSAVCQNLLHARGSNLVVNP